VQRSLHVRKHVQKAITDAIQKIGIKISSLLRDEGKSEWQKISDDSFDIILIYLKGLFNVRGQLLERFVKKALIFRCLRANQVRSIGVETAFVS